MHAWSKNPPLFKNNIVNCLHSKFEIVVIFDGWLNSFITNYSSVDDGGWNESEKASQEIAKAYGERLVLLRDASEELNQDKV